MKMNKATATVTLFMSCCVFKSIQILAMLSFCLILFACEKPIENPELADRIYNDLLDDAKTSTGLATTEEKNLESIHKDIAALKAGDNTRKNKMRQMFESQTKIESFKQKSQYFQLRAYKRKEYVLDNYPKYFAKHLPWPDQDEWHDYQAAKKLQMASRDWSTRVPRLGKRIKEYNTAAATQYSGGAKAEGEKKEGGEKPTDGAKPEGEASEKPEKAE